MIRYLSLTNNPFTNSLHQYDLSLRSDENGSDRNENGSHQNKKVFMRGIIMNFLFPSRMESIRTSPAHDKRRLVGMVCASNEYHQRVCTLPAPHTLSHCTIIHNICNNSTQNGKELWPHLTAPFMEFLLRAPPRVVKFDPVDKSTTHIGPDFGDG